MYGLNPLHVAILAVLYGGGALIFCLAAYLLVKWASLAAVRQALSERDAAVASDSSHPSSGSS
jgi:hypothetical protein